MLEKTLPFTAGAPTTNYAVKQKPESSGPDFNSYLSTGSSAERDSEKTEEADADSRDDQRTGTATEAAAPPAKDHTEDKNAESDEAEPTFDERDPSDADGTTADAVGAVSTVETAEEARPDETTFANLAQFIGDEGGLDGAETRAPGQSVTEAQQQTGVAASQGALSGQSGPQTAEAHRAASAQTAEIAKRAEGRDAAEDTAQSQSEEGEAVRAASVQNANRYLATTAPQAAANALAAAYSLSQKDAEGSGDSDALLKVDNELATQGFSGSGQYSAYAQELGQKAPNQATYRPEAVMRQVAEAVQRNGDGRVEIRLNPDELGRVHIQMTTTDSGIAMTVNAERPETTELLRRHIEMLAREFEGMGFENIEFQFGSDSDSNQNASPSQGAASLDAIAAAAPEDRVGHSPIYAPTGLDIRI